MLRHRTVLLLREGDIESKAPAGLAGQDLRANILEKKGFWAMLLYEG